MSQGFGYPAFPVDTHIHRLAQRWKLTNGRNVTQTEKRFKKIIPKDFVEQTSSTNYFLWERILQSKKLLWSNV